MRKPVVFMFSGQGSQYYQMGRDLFLDDPTFRHWMLTLNDVYKELSGASILHQLYGSERRKSGTFDRLTLTHPAIFMVEFALAMTLMERGIIPDYVLGASLGEFVSCAVAGIFDYHDALACVVKQAEIVEATCREGGMLAVLQSKDLYEQEPDLYRKSELAAINYSSHFVVSGLADALAEIEGYLKVHESLYQRLSVRYAFHSSFIDPAKKAFTAFSKSQTFRRPEMNLISCLTGGPIHEVNNDFFWNIAREKIDFPHALEYLSCTCDGFVLLDLGPSGTLANFAKHHPNAALKADIIPIMSPYQHAGKQLQKFTGCSVEMAL
ncbi:acyltransferase domain-containing protein [Paenibacillus sp. HJL G12]|uniref:Acyltransferase domain-containing protein n=1 Tax=Paenibacillus dendrobii TaxID=2691084 RepID=A0A7X3IJY6_9BACL|nr:acyltransferase domain-containing protein [Paenibacillus dendrobii]MWV45359.1 acyltransferase domain-containing protein [Paenibacillus dendrobii]